MLVAAFTLLPLGAHAGTTALICPPLAQSQMDNGFGAGTSSQTCVCKTARMSKPFINMSSAALNKSCASQQVVNMVDNYNGMYGIQINDDFYLVVAGHGAGGRWLLTDAAYNRTFAVIDRLITSNSFKPQPAL